jgi:hypothetical protein
MAELSGPQWCARFPGSAKTGDLLPDFRDRVDAFISAMQSAAASVRVSATFRPPERAYLMHWCCMIADSGQDPAAVPAMAGVNIRWAHTSLANSKAAAAAMKKQYAIKFPAALVSRHTQRRAVDMTIGWQGTLAIRDFDGKLHHITSAPRDGSNPELMAVGATFGVIKLPTDPPHWSDDGH